MLLQVGASSSPLNVLTVYRYQSANTEGYPFATQTRTIGSCTGLLAASAVSSCCSLADLIEVAVDTVRIAFRIGALVAETAAEIERTLAQAQSWSVIVPNLSAEAAKDILDKFHEAEVTQSSNL